MDGYRGSQLTAGNWPKVIDIHTGPTAVLFTTCHQPRGTVCLS